MLRPTATASWRASIASSSSGTSATCEACASRSRLQGAVQGGRAGAPAPAARAGRFPAPAARVAGRRRAGASGASLGLAALSAPRAGGRRGASLLIADHAARCATQSMVLQQAQRTYQAEMPMDIVGSDCRLDRVVVPRPRRLPRAAPAFADSSNCKGGRLVNVGERPGAYLVLQDTTATGSPAGLRPARRIDRGARSARRQRPRDLLRRGPRHLDRRLPRPRPRLRRDLGPRRGCAHPHGHRVFPGQLELRRASSLAAASGPNPRVSVGRDRPRGSQVSGKKRGGSVRMRRLRRRDGRTKSPVHRTG